MDEAGRPAEAAIPPAEVDDPLALLEQLQATPDLLAAVAACSPAERVSQKGLRARFEAALVREAVALHEARLRAADRLPAADRLWLTRTGSEQATAWPVARHKAIRFAGCDRVADLCCGVGSDAAALSQQTEVLAVDRAAAMVWRARQNAAVLGRPERFTGEVADVTARDWAGWWVHADPDRRAGRSRPTRRLAEYRPGLDWMRHLLVTTRGGAIKLGPASDWPRQFAGQPHCEVELTSHAGECREATVWFGELAGCQPRRATNLITGESLAGTPREAGRRVAESVGAVLAEPDPAVVRAGLVDLLAEQHGLARLDADEDYLTGDTGPLTGLAASFTVEAVLSASSKLVRQFFRQQPRRAYEIKCRRLTVDVEAVRRQLPTGDGEPAVVIFCRISGRSRAVIASRC